MASIDTARRNMRRLLTEKGIVLKSHFKIVLSTSQRPYVGPVLRELEESGEVQIKKIDKGFECWWTGAMPDEEPIRVEVANSHRAVCQRLFRTRGPARDRLCACGNGAASWAYVGGDPDELTDELPGYPGHLRAYSVSLDYYEPVCFRCHVAISRGTVI